MPETDDIGHTIDLQQPPGRIVSLVPSQTELLADLGLSSQVVGITKFCVHPESWYRTKTRIGGTKSVDFKKVQQLHPELIIANKEENDKTQIERLREICPVYVTDVRTLDDALRMISGIGRLTGKTVEADKISVAIRQRFSEISPPTQRKTCAYLIWNDPIMTINHDTFIHDMLQRSGYDNVFGSETNSRYPVISPERLQAASPEFVLLSSEPFPFREKHIQRFQEMMPASKILIADGEMFSWYGSRLMQFDPQKIQRVEG